ncbi:MAG: N-acetylmuramoyl-L-alanine amidase [SAR324 cluster bacterium]|nr:N-acetylmuramoyl-L-alanine amidase [SAR324 cluster bacterium]
MKQQSFFYGQGGPAIEASRWMSPATIVTTHYWATANRIKIVLNTSREVPYVYGWDTHTQRMYVDFIDVESFTPPQAMLHEENGVLKQILLEPLNQRITRLWIQPAKPLMPKITAYTVATRNTITIRLEEEEVPVEQAVIARPTPAQTIRPVTIIIDPGHGGNDPGASAFGVNEKDIVLQVAKKLYRLLLKNTPHKVFMTRQGDSYVSREKRAQFARNKKGDLLISLHTNSHTDPMVHGIELYYLESVRDQASMNAAIRENEMSDQEIHQLADVLQNLSLRKHTSLSNQLARSLHDRLMQAITSRYAEFPRDLGIKEAPFLILMHSRMPSVLMELAFITNPEENQRLTNRDYQQVLAEGMFHGIQEFLLKRTSRL